MLNPFPLIDTHSWSCEFHSSIWKLYTPPSRAVTFVGEHVDWAAAFPGVARKTTPATSTAAMLKNCFAIIIHHSRVRRRPGPTRTRVFGTRRMPRAVRSFLSGTNAVEIVPCQATGRKERGLNQSDDLADSALNGVRRNPVLRIRSASSKARRCWLFPMNRYFIACQYSTGIVARRYPPAASALPLRRQGVFAAAVGRVHLPRNAKPCPSRPQIAPRLPNHCLHMRSGHFAEANASAAVHERSADLHR